MNKNDIANALINGSYVTYENARYKLLGFFLYFNKTQKKLCYSVEMLDKNNKTIVRAPIEMVEVAGKEVKDNA